MMSRSAKITLSIALDNENLPTRIEWQATEAKSETPALSQSVMLSLWDREQKTLAAIDLWTEEMTVSDMNLYFYQVIHKMADTYRRATNSREIADLIHGFGDCFGDAAGLTAPTNEEPLSSEASIAIPSIAILDGEPKNRSAQ